MAIAAWLGAELSLYLAAERWSIARKVLAT